MVRGSSHTVHTRERKGSFSWWCSEAVGQHTVCGCWFHARVSACHLVGRDSVLSETSKLYASRARQARARMPQNKIAFAVGAAAGATVLLAAQRYWRRRRARPAAAGCVDVNPGFRVEGEEREVYRRFLAVYDRKVVYPDGRVADFDIVGHPRSYHFVCVFVFHTADRSVTLLREFAQAGLPEAALVFGLACGGYDPRKHRSVQHAAESELSEEAQLEGGEWMRLLPANHPGVLEAKW